MCSVIGLYHLPDMVEGELFGGKMGSTKVKEPHHTVNNKENAFQVALARGNFQTMDFFVHWYIASTSRHSDIC